MIFSYSEPYLYICIYIYIYLIRKSKIKMLPWRCASRSLRLYPGAETLKKADCGSSPA